MTTPTLVTIDRAAELAAVSRRTIQTFIKDGKLEAVEQGDTDAYGNKIRLVTISSLAALEEAASVACLCVGPRGRFQRHYYNDRACVRCGAPITMIARRSRKSRSTKKSALPRAPVRPVVPVATFQPSRFRGGIAYSVLYGRICR